MGAGKLAPSPPNDEDIMRVPNLKEEREAAKAEADARVAAAAEARRRELKAMLYPGFPGKLNLGALSGPELEVIATNAGKKSTVDVSGKDGENDNVGLNQDAVDFVLGKLKDETEKDLTELRKQIKAEIENRSRSREERSA